MPGVPGYSVCREVPWDDRGRVFEAAGLPWWPHVPWAGVSVPVWRGGARRAGGRDERFVSWLWTVPAGTAWRFLEHLAGPHPVPLGGGAALALRDASVPAPLRATAARCPSLPRTAQDGVGRAVRSRSPFPVPLRPPEARSWRRS